MRLCVDYRKLNSLTTKDKFPLPKIDTCLDMLNGCEFFSTCDLHWGYWQTEMDERDRDKTAFVTRKGQWRFKVLSFGLANAPSQFARIMELVMSGLTYDVCLVYLDDILIFSKTFDEHLDCLATVFERLNRCIVTRVPLRLMLTCEKRLCRMRFTGVTSVSCGRFVRSSATTLARTYSMELLRSIYSSPDGRISNSMGDPSPIVFIGW